MVDHHSTICAMYANTITGRDENRMSIIREKEVDKEETKQGEGWREGGAQTEIKRLTLAQ